MQYPSDAQRGSERVFSAPAMTAAPPAVPFPVIGCIAPVFASVVIWAITQSGFALVFAALGPIIAVASIVDSRWQQKRRAVIDTASFFAGMESLRKDVDKWHALEREQLAAEAPPASELLAVTVHESRGWRQPAGQPGRIAAGRGNVESRTRIDGDGSLCELAQLREVARVLIDAPVVLNAGLGIGIVGPRALAQALARGYLIQLLHTFPPGLAELNIPASPAWEWAKQLTHLVHDVSGPALPPSGQTPDSQDSEVSITIMETQGNGAERATRLDTFAGTRRPANDGRQVRRILMAIAEAERALPAQCQSVVRITGVGTASALMAGTVPDNPTAAEVAISIELVSVADAAEHVRVLIAHARTLGLSFEPTASRDRVMLADLLLGRPDPGPGRKPNDSTSCHDSLSAVIGIPLAGAASVATPTSITVAAAMSVDLVSDGPHAIVGGTTGSGKSELLTTWITSMAMRHPPETVTFLLVDFKGGAAFTPLLPLPHCVGLITDLDETEAARALESLRAEIRYREAMLRDAGVRDISETAPEMALARLVIVVDEFATMLQAFPDLHALFVDIAARGRSLGMHVILSTQRPAGVVRDSLLANCNLRLSLRVNNSEDSIAVIGTDNAAWLPVSPAGSCMISTASSGTRALQIATTTPAVIGDVVERHSLSDDGQEHDGTPPGRPWSRVRRPWLDPLPRSLQLSALTGAASTTRVDAGGVGGATSVGASAENARFLLGLADIPSEQCQVPADYAPSEDGHLLVIGARGSGKTTLLDTVGSQNFVGWSLSLIPADMEGAWDALHGWAGSVRDRSVAMRANRLLLIDDLDSVCAHMLQEYQQEFLDTMAFLLRDGPGAGLYLAVTVQRSSGAVQHLIPLFTSTLILRMPSKQDHLMCGGDPGDWQGDLPPGGGTWRRHRIQVALTAGSQFNVEHSQPDRLVFEPGHDYLVVTTAVTRRIRSLTAALGHTAVVVDIGQHHLPLGELEIVRERPATVFVGDADDWQSQWTLLTNLRQRVTLVFEGCALADYRAIARRRELPPPLAPGRSGVWVLPPAGEVFRAQWSQEKD